MDLQLPNAKIVILSGGGQTVALGESLPIAVTARLDIDGKPASGETVTFLIIADGSPGPNHTWYAMTDANGVATGNGVIQNTGRRAAQILAVYEVCMDRFPIKGCTEYKKAASAGTTLTVN